MINIETILDQRARSFLARKHLAVHCYRIRRRFALPLPLVERPTRPVSVRAFKEREYPWLIWALWALEERVLTLGFAAELGLGEGSRRVCQRELLALSSWPAFCANNKLDLPFAHAGYTLSTALEWGWLNASFRETLEQALHRYVDEGLPLLPERYLSGQSVAVLASEPKVYQHLHNIALITFASLALAAERCGHVERERLSSALFNWLIVRYDSFADGFTEGASYDGYLATFVVSWLFTQPQSRADAILTHPGFADLARQCQVLACPGAPERSAELGDVEPAEMPFVWSALAKAQQLTFCPERDALLQSVDVGWLRADGLAIGISQARTKSDATDLEVAGLLAAVDDAGFQACNSAVSLGSGAGAGEVKVVASLSRSPMNHIQVDNGTVAIGYRGRWWITGPGYQQYLKTSEREFTLGAAAHNTPVIAGKAQTSKCPRLYHHGQRQDGIAFMLLDLTDCYPDDLGLGSAVRAIWLIDQAHVVVCDTLVMADTALPVQYSWHGHPDAYWGVDRGALFLSLEDAPGSTCWVSSPAHIFQMTDIQRLKGSRGQQSLQVLSNSASKHWWVFSFTDQPPGLSLIDDSQLKLNDWRLSLSELRPVDDSPRVKVAIASKMMLQASFFTEVMGLRSPVDWCFEVKVNNQLWQSVKTTGVGHAEIMPPMITATDQVSVSAYSESLVADDHSVATYVLDKKEIAQILSIPLRVSAHVTNNDIVASCHLLPDAMSGGAEYAFYLLVDGERVETAWYTENSTHHFVCKDEWRGRNVTVRGFARSKDNNDQKISQGCAVAW